MKCWGLSATSSTTCSRVSVAASSRVGSRSSRIRSCSTSSCCSAAAASRSTTKPDVSPQRDPCGSTTSAEGGGLARLEQRARRAGDRLVLEHELDQLLAAVEVALAELAAGFPELGRFNLQVLDVTHVGAHAQLGATRRAENELELGAWDELLLGMNQQTIGADIADRGIHRDAQAAGHPSCLRWVDHDWQAQLAPLASGP